MREKEMQLLILLLAAHLLQATSSDTSAVFFVHLLIPFVNEPNVRFFVKMLMTPSHRKSLRVDIFQFCKKQTAL